MLWGQTEAIPGDQHTTAGAVTAYTVLIDDKDCATPTREHGRSASAGITTPLAASTATLTPDRNEITSVMMAAAAIGEPKINAREPELGSDAPSTRPHFQQQTSGYSSEDENREQTQRGRSSGRRRGARQRLKKPAVVREVKLTTPSNPGTAVAAALLLADGCVWWVSDLQVGTWERVTVPVDEAAVTNGVTEEGFLSSSGVSAVAVVGSLPRQNHADKENFIASERGGKSVTGEEDSGGCEIGSKVAIVAGRDDGWLFLLSQSQKFHMVDPDEVRSDKTSSLTRAWRVSAAWKGHRSKVTAVWPLSDAARDRSPRASSGESQEFTAAMETSRLSNFPSRRTPGGDRFDGALVSAGAGGTVAWWEWACVGGDRKMAHGGKPASGCEQMVMAAPRLRMVGCIRDELALTQRYGCFLCGAPLVFDAGSHRSIDRLRGFVHSVKLNAVYGMSGGKDGEWRRFDLVDHERRTFSPSTPRFCLPSTTSRN